MKRLMTFLVAGLVVASALPTQASLFGPWRRYRSEGLGFQVPYVDDWQITELKNCVVFAMQLSPYPYVRLAVGRIAAGSDTFEQSVRTQLVRLRQDNFRQVHTTIDGHPAIRIEGTTAEGRMLDYYVDQGMYRYWISFIADQPETWEAYQKSFDLILSDFRFLAPEPTLPTAQKQTEPRS